MKHAIAEYHGADDLVTAAVDLLERPNSGIHAAVIRGLPIEHLVSVGVDIEELAAGQAMAALALDMPQFSTLDKIVEGWASRHLRPPYSFAGRYDHLRAAGGIPPHYDERALRQTAPPRTTDYEGPLTFSLRLDDSHVTRRFGAVFSGVNLMTPNGIDAAAKAELEISTLKPYDPNHEAVQNAGDMVLFRNYPTPTVHWVRELDPDGERARYSGLTLSYIGSWLIRHAE